MCGYHVIHIRHVSVYGCDVGVVIRVLEVSEHVAATATCAVSELRTGITYVYKKKKRTTT